LSISPQADVSDPSAGPAWTEAQRLAALRSYDILDTAPERAFDDLVRLTGQLLGAPIVAINLIDADRLVCAKCRLTIRSANTRCWKMSA
jgi:hypothetical protein